MTKIETTIRSVSSQEWEDTAPEWRSRQIESVVYRMAIGCDLAYSEGTGDYGAIIPVIDYDGKFWVRNCISFRRDVLHARKELVKVQRDYPGAPLVSYVSGPEKGIIQLLAQEMIDEHGRVWPPVLVASMIARGDIVIRAQATGEMWNSGGIIVPPGRPWTGELVDELRAFTGSGSRKDRLSALISAVDYLLAGRAMGTSETGAFKRTRV